MVKSQKSSAKSQKSSKKSEDSADTPVSTLKQTKISSNPQTMEELLAQSGITTFSLKKGDTVKGTVVFVSSREVLVDMGKKSFGIVAEWELDQVRDYVSNLKEGDKVVAQVVNPENDYGYTVLSLRKDSQLLCH